MARKSAAALVAADATDGAAEGEAAGFDPSQAQDFAAEGVSEESGGDGAAAAAETFAAGGEVDPPEGVEAAIAEAAAELEEASAAAAEAMAAEGIAVPPVQAEPREAKEKPRRERPTPQQQMKLAARQRAYGRKLLDRRTVGFASVVREVKLNNAVLAAVFERFFPNIDRAAFLLVRRGPVAIGEKASQQLLDRMTEMARRVVADREGDLRAAHALVEGCAENADFITPRFVQPAFKREIQIHTPQGLSTLNAFLQADELLTNLDTLYWNGERNMSNVNEEVLRTKRAMRPLFEMAGRTTLSLYRKFGDKVVAGKEGAASAATRDAA